MFEKISMDPRYANTHTYIGGGIESHVFRVSPTIAVKAAYPNIRPQDKTEPPPLSRDIAFYKRLNERDDRCSSIVDCFIILPRHLFLSYCANGSIGDRLRERQEHESGDCLERVTRVTEYEDSALIARWIQQVTSALAYLEKMGFCHNDLHTDNCLLDESFNLKLADFGRATTIGQLIEANWAPWAIELNAGPLKNTCGLCSARTEQFAAGTLLYYMVYGHGPYEDTRLSRTEIRHRFNGMSFPELNRHEMFDHLISSCWYNVYPTMALMAYDFRRKTIDIAPVAEYKPIDHARERKACEALIRRGILGPDLALQFEPAWRRYLHAAKRTLIWRFLIGLPRWFWLWVWGPTERKPGAEETKH